MSQDPPTPQSLSKLDRRLSALIGAMLIVVLSVGTLRGQSNSVEIIEGYSQPRRISSLATSTNGIIQELMATEGAPVKQGECLVQLNDGVHRQLVKIAELRVRARGELEAAEAELKSNRHRLKIISGLAKQGSATPDELLRTESDYELSQANLKSVQEQLALRTAEYEKLRVESRNYCVEAPFDGVLVEYLKQKGEFVGAADPAVCIVADLTELSVEFLVHSRYRKHLGLNLPVEVHFVDSGKRVAGIVYYVSPFPDGETNTYKVKVNVPNHDYALNAGERCQLENQPDGFRRPAAPAAFTNRPKSNSSIN